ALPFFPGEWDENGNVCISSRPWGHAPVAVEIQCPFTVPYARCRRHELAHLLRTRTSRCYLQTHRVAGSGTSRERHRSRGTTPARAGLPDGIRHRYSRNRTQPYPAYDRAHRRGRGYSRSRSRRGRLWPERQECASLVPPLARLEPALVVLANPASYYVGI